QVKNAYKSIDPQLTLPDEVLRHLPACVEACPTQALSFGNLNDERSAPNHLRKSGRSYEVLPELNVRPAINYLAKASFHIDTGDGGH
ncbi:MAG: hypothetical protein HN348_05780, partial [Proteobacteria bacterium]|nr:hypothetical protein [Pseudomonadota bacterium]